MPGTTYRWHAASDGAATFPTPDGGWILASNSEADDGGAGAIRFDRSGEIRGAYRILGGTTANCSGGATPWGTWLSCEEVEGGLVWECDPTGRRRAAEPSTWRPPRTAVSSPTTLAGGGSRRSTTVWRCAIRR